MSKITYAMETLYHFHCHNCDGYFNLSGRLPPKVMCSHCGFQAEAEEGPPSTLLSIAGGLAARAIEAALNKGLSIEIPSLRIRINKEGVMQKSSRGDSFSVKPNASESPTD